MNKIIYPKNRAAFHDSYSKIFSKGKVKSIDAHLNTIVYARKLLNFNTLITLSIEELIKLKPKIDKYYLSQNVKTKVKDKKGKYIIKNDFANLFNYKTMQPKLACFFMNQGGLKLESCHYCSIDYINAFIDFPDYQNGLQFVNKADEYDLQFIEGIDALLAKKIIAGRKANEYATYSKIPVNTKILKVIKSIPFDKSHNHFTLDHLFPQNSHPYYSLSLYNLVPSCYSCNSKFKNDIEFKIDDDLKYVSPTSDNYSFNEKFEFELFFLKKLGDVKKESDFELRKKITDCERQVQTYLRMFKIMGRHLAHKGQILNLIQKKQSYPESKIKELSNDTGLSQNKIRKMIFGEDLFSVDFGNQPLVKFRRDIAKNISIIKK